MACPFADNSSPHVYLRLLSSLLPPSSRQPGPVAVLLGQTLKLCLIFSPVSHSLGVDRETSSGCFSRVFLCIFYDRKFEFQVVLFILLLHRSDGDHQCDTDWQKAAQCMKKMKKKNAQCQWSHLPWLKKINELDPAFIWNQQLFIKIYTCTRRLKGTLQLTETRLLFGNIRYIYTPLCMLCQDANQHPMMQKATWSKVVNYCTIIKIMLVSQ